MSVVWPGRNGLGAEFTTRGDDRIEYGEILCTSDADAFAVESDLESDHRGASRPTFNGRHNADGYSSLPKTLDAPTAHLFSW